MSKKLEWLGLNNTSRLAVLWLKLGLKFPIPEKYKKYVSDCGGADYLDQVFKYIESRKDGFELYKHFLMERHGAVVKKEAALGDYGASLTPSLNAVQENYGDKQVWLEGLLIKDLRVAHNIVTDAPMKLCLLCKTSSAQPTKVLYVCLNSDCLEYFKEEINKAVLLVQQIRTYHPKMTVKQAVNEVKLAHYYYRGGSPAEIQGYILRKQIVANKIGVKGKVKKGQK